jgi:hypothetical protein
VCRPEFREREYPLRKGFIRQIDKCVGTERTQNRKYFTRKALQETALQRNP